MIDWEVVDGLPELDLDNLALLNDKVNSASVALTAEDNITAWPSWLYGQTPEKSGRLENATPCVVILVASEEDPRDLDAFYFYFYSYNRGANITKVLQPIRGLLEGKIDHEMTFGDHVGDWEYNMVRFRQGKPTGIYFSQHSDGSVYDWDNAALTVEHERPIVYSAIGSHANWVSPGTHVHDAVLIDYCDAGRQWDPVSSAYFFRFDPLTSTLTRVFRSGSPDDKALNSTSFLYFSGLWGDLQYPDDHPRQKTVPYFGLKRFVSGPTGPMSKHLVRKGLFPDHREKKSWTQWGVLIFMSLYPCCLRGWRVWVTAIIFVGTLVLLVLGISYTAKRYLLKGRGYEKVNIGADIPLDSLDYRDDNTNIHQSDAPGI